LKIDFKMTNENHEFMDLFTITNFSYKFTDLTNLRIITTAY
jgi:hypothetical protein